MSILDYNGNQVFESNIDKTYSFGPSGDIPVGADWTGTGTSKIGGFRGGYLWILDANGNGVYDGTGAGQDLVFPLDANGNHQIDGAASAVSHRVFLLAGAVRLISDAAESGFYG